MRGLSIKDFGAPFVFRRVLFRQGFEPPELFQQPGKRFVGRDDGAMPFTVIAPEVQPGVTITTLPAPPVAYRPIPAVDGGYVSAAAMPNDATARDATGTARCALRMEAMTHMLPQHEAADGGTREQRRGGLLAAVRKMTGRQLSGQ